jgi:heme-degrading monooxygenase HmoA
MIAVLFEVWPHPDGRQTYLDIAASLVPRLEEIDGFVSVERFQCLTDPEKLLSLSFFRDEEAVARWRNLEAHRHAQVVGRTGLFRDYRIRVASVVRDYTLAARAQAPDPALPSPFGA